MSKTKSYETILRAAKNSMIHGRREPHCFSSHVIGQGYIGKADQPDYKAQLERSAQSEIDNIGFASGYAEPGYTDPEHGILFANWNVFPRNIAELLARAGYECEWSDEWTTCGDCGKAVRQSPDCYHWTSYYRIVNECELLCLDCLDAADYLESIEDDPDHACPPQDKFNPLHHGYVKHNGEFETGWHEHMNDDPRKLLKELQAQSKQHIVFRIAENSQFYTTWEAFYKPSSE